jgi:hypothetical protein
MHRWGRVRIRLVGGSCCSALILLLVAACSSPPDPIVVDEGMVTVENQTAREWRNLKVTVNDHFSGGAAVLLPGGRMTAPLGQFQTGLGQKFDRSRQSVFKVEVTATEPDGTPVRLTWEPNPDAARGRS